MKGYPSHLNTKEDYEYVRVNFPAAQWKQDWQALLDGMTGWVFSGALESASTGINDDTHKVVSSKEMDGESENETFAQYELKVIPSCKLFQLGFTENYVRGVLA